jgi:hypothetical protein
VDTYAKSVITIIAIALTIVIAGDLLLYGLDRNAHVHFHQNRGSPEARPR